MLKIFQSWRSDLPSSLVVFIVALPLCLGVGLASTSIPGMEGMPNPVAGLVAGIVGGIVVGLFSGSRVGVSGPAAGLITIVISGIQLLGSFEGFLLAVFLAGALQIIAGFCKAGTIGNYFPSAVIKGMLAAIGIMLILKEIPHLIGFDKDFFGDESFFQKDGHNTLSELYFAFLSLNKGSLLIGLFSVICLLLLDLPALKKLLIFKFVPGALLVVLLAIAINIGFYHWWPSGYVMPIHRVQIPKLNAPVDLFNFLKSPDWSFLNNVNVYIIAFTLAIVGSLETLLSIEATDKLDPMKFTTPTNRELKAQGLGNMLSGLIGGLPVTQVIVRSSANINAGGKSKLSTIIHGLLLALSLLFLAPLLNLIPLSVLAAILILIGYKLSKVSMYKQIYKLGMDQFIPFLGTIIGVLLTDLLKGIGIGIVLSVFFILRKNFQKNIEKSDSDDGIVLTLSEDVNFINKPGLIEQLNNLPNDSKVIIDCSNCKNMDHDVSELLHDFVTFKASNKNIQVTLKN